MWCTRTSGAARLLYFQSVWSVCVCESWMRMMGWHCCMTLIKLWDYIWEFNQITMLRIIKRAKAFTICMNCCADFRLCYVMYDLSTFTLNTYHVTNFVFIQCESENHFRMFFFADICKITIIICKKTKLFLNFILKIYKSSDVFFVNVANHRTESKRPKN